MFGTISDPALRAAASVGVTALLLSLAVSLLVLAMRLRALRAERRAREVMARWRPLLVRHAADEPVALPPLGRRERMPLLLLWNQMQESLRGEAHQRLTDVGLRLGLYALAHRLIRSRHLGERVLGYATIGQFAWPEDAPLLRAQLARRHTPASLAAARALLRIDAHAAAPLVLERYLAHSDWPAPRVGTLLRETPASAISDLFSQRLLQGSVYEQLRLLPMLRFAEVPQVDSVLDRLVQTSEAPQVLSIAMRQLHGPAAIARVRTLARHADPLVRSAAAQALGRIGAGEDENLLIDMMADPNWWVRYRAAQALAGMPRTGPDDMVQLRRITADRYARDMLDQVLAERALEAVEVPA